MAFDFPNSPSIGQRVTGVGGIVYVWDGVKWASNIGSVTAQSMGDVGRNLLHNPLFNVAQRGTAVVTTTAGYPADRWFTSVSLDVVNFSSGADFTDTARTAIGDESIRTNLSNGFAGNAGAGSFSFICQKIEDVRRLAGKTVTVSFWSAASVSLKLGVNVGQQFGTGGSPSTAVNVNGVSVQLTTTWGTRYTATFTLPSISGKTLGTNNDHCTQLNFWYSCGTTNALLAGSIGVQTGTIVIAGVQLEIGSVATPLEKPDPRYDLANCQRFYQQGVTNLGQAGNGGGPIGTWIGYQQMRAIPTLAFQGTTYSNASGINAAGGPTLTGFTMAAACIATGNAYITGGTWTASADL